jgi:hypothetical protein
VAAGASLNTSNSSSGVGDMDRGFTDPLILSLQVYYYNNINNIIII